MSKAYLKILVSQKPKPLKAKKLRADMIRIGLPQSIEMKLASIIPYLKQAEIREARGILTEALAELAQNRKRPLRVLGIIPQLQKETQTSLLLRY